MNFKPFCAPLVLVTSTLISATSLAEATVTINMAPSPVLSVSGLDHESVQLSWSYEGEESAFIIEQRENGSASWTVVLTTEIGATETTISGLAELTEYDFRVKAVIPQENELWSNMLTARTSETPVQDDSDANNDSNNDNSSNNDSAADSSESSSGGSLNLLYLLFVLSLLGIKKASVRRS